MLSPPCYDYQLKGRLRARPLNSQLPLLCAFEVAAENENVSGHQHGDPGYDQVFHRVMFWVIGLCVGLTVLALALFLCNRRRGDPRHRSGNQIVLL